MDSTKILIVEDELLIARDLSKKLTKMGYEIAAVVSSGQAALAAIADHWPDLVLMDIVIKGELDGIDTAQAVHQQFGIPVIYITAYADDDTLQRAEQSGAYGYILKPFNERELHASIKLAMQKSKQYQDLHHQSTRDALTSLYNRRYLEESLSQERLRAEQQNTCFSVLMIDIDHFKRFNDTYGHDAGDYVLKEVSLLLQEAVRVSDIVCRYGGEELLALLPTCNEDQAHVLASLVRVRISLLQLVHSDRPLGPITVSIGVASFPKHATTETALLKAADEALYQAKAEGRNQVVIAPVVSPWMQPHHQGG